MTKWTLIIRQPNRPLEKGLVACDLTFDTEPTLPLRYADLERLEIALADALAGINRDLPNRFECVAAGSRFILIVDGESRVTLSREEVERLRRDLRETIPL